MLALRIQGQFQCLARHRVGCLLQRLRRGHAGHAGAAGLATGRHHNAVPVRQPLLGAGGVQLHFGPLRVHRYKGLHAQLGGLLQDQVHLLATGDALQQGDVQRRFVVQRGGRLDTYLRVALAHCHQGRAVVLAIAIEQHAAIAFAQAHHADQVVGGILGQRQGLPDRQRMVDMAAGHAHATASSMAARVVSASRSKCSSSTQYGGIQYSTLPSGRSTTPRLSAAL